jgi:hypothetical protein
MPDTVIACVNALGTDQPEQLIFTDQCRCPIGDVEIPGVMDFEEEDDNNAVMPVLDPVDIGSVKLPGVDIAGQAQQNVEIDDLNIPQPDPPLIKTVEEPAVPTIKHDEPSEVAQPMEATGLRRSTRVRPQPKHYEPTMTGSKYSHAIMQLETHGVLHPDSHMFIQEDFYQSDPDVMAHVMTQLSLKSGLKQWGDKAYTVVMSEMKQLHFWKTFKPKHWNELSETHCQTVLESHMFLKEKRDGSLKGRTVARGNKWQDYISKEDASSPTITTEAVLLSCIIDAKEERDVTVIDIPNPFIQTRVEDEEDMAIIKIRGVLLDILVQIAPNIYKSYVTTNKKGMKQLLVQGQNALYGTMVASLLYYHKFTKSLTSVGFKINPYDPCVANKTVDGTQMTICFHVDDCKLSHHSSRANDNMIDLLRQEYESIFEDGLGQMTVSRGRVHKYLGMTLDYTVHGQVNILMFDYIDEIINAFDKAEPKGSGTKPSAALDNLFKVDEDHEKLPHEKAVEFHNLVAKTLYATK